MGCTRAGYRVRADRDTWNIVSERAAGPKWNLPPQNVYRDPSSRLSDTTSYDRPPMPPDDPTSHRYMHRVAGMRGYPHWHRNGDVPFVDNGQWRNFLPYDEEGRVVMDRATAVQVALTNSRDYQFEVEELYLNALDVTGQRFQFMTQYFATTTSSFTADGADRPGGPGASQSALSNNTLAQVKKTTAIGTSIVVGLANSFVWQYSGAESETAFTLLNFNIIQPLLRFGTRVRVLESLTQAERTLLCNVRQLDQYRQGFYNSVVTGRATGDSPNRNPGLTGVGSAGVGVTNLTGTGTVGGYLGLLQVQQQIRNQRFNITGLRDSLAQLQEMFDAGRIPNPLQVEQSRQALYTGQTTLINNIASYQTRLDAFKIQLGLPPHLEVRIKDNFLDPFMLIDDSINDLQDRLEDLLDEARMERAEPNLERMADILDRTLAFHDISESELSTAKDDLAKALAAREPRRAQLLGLSKRPEILQGMVDIRPYQPDQLDERLERIEKNVAQLDTGLADSWTKLKLMREQLAQQPLPETAVAMVELITNLSSQLLELSLAQAASRLETVTLIPVELTDLEALDIARQNRRDWMNARSALVDNWRQIEFTANALRSGLNVSFAGDLRSINDVPFNFRDSTGRLQVGVTFDAPLTRYLERNDFREAIVDYQRARRAYMLFEDRVSQGLRATLRILRLNALNFELRRAAVITAVKTVDLARERLREPPRAAAAAGVSTISPTTARDLVSALSDLLNAQNDFLSVWVNYESLRMSLDFELGTLRLDAQGEWIDPGKIDATRGMDADFSDAPSGHLSWPDYKHLVPEELPKTKPADAEELPPKAPAVEELPKKPVPPPPLPGDQPRPRPELPGPKPAPADKTEKDKDGRKRLVSTANHPKRGM
ncbi:MAG: hypothetical protein JSS27_03725 [Planctomycetes bacterium]|nr:hypothetical protein [Planctomycetota bacterium]